MSDPGDTARDEPPSFVERLSGAVALLGGLLALFVALLVVTSVLGRWLGGSPLAAKLRWLGPVNGDFEMVQMATAVAIFAFLPYCQVRRGNIVVDTFTARFRPRTNGFIDAFWDVVYAGMMGLLAVSLATGALEHYRSGQTTMLLQLIVWPALALCTLLCFLLAFTALATAAARVRGRS
jgi:TRAP-type C4-dicarboxylate transport system permease small subunit